MRLFLCVCVRLMAVCEPRGSAKGKAERLIKISSNPTFRLQDRFMESERKKKGMRELEIEGEKDAGREGEGEKDGEKVR